MKSVRARTGGSPESDRAVQVEVIGIDCATAHEKVGVARGVWLDGKLEVHEVEVCGRERTAAFIVAEWLAGPDGPALLALDAPLGWPRSMGEVLSEHRAGDPIGVPPNDLFRRDTDRFIQRTLGKTPLDVGADRIARTAHAALRLLGEVRSRLGNEIPLAWSAPPSGMAAIEVYPAATLLARGMTAWGYKRRESEEARRTIACALPATFARNADLSLVEASNDALDGVVCLVAAKDFLDGRAVGPIDRPLAEKEGWIWAPPLQEGGA